MKVDSGYPKGKTCKLLAQVMERNMEALNWTLHPIVVDIKHLNNEGIFETNIHLPRQWIREVNRWARRASRQRTFVQLPSV